MSDARKKKKVEPPKKVEKPKIESSDSSDLEQLLEIKKKYKNRPRLSEKEEIPILKKTPQPPKPPEIVQNGPPILAQFPKSENGAYRIPQHLHKNYPHAIRLYLGNLPDQFDKEELHHYLRQNIEQAGGAIEAGDPIYQIQLQVGQKYCFVQFRSIEETEGALQLEGLLFHGKPIRFRRVKDYDISPKIEGERPIPKINQQKNNDGALRLHVSGLGLDCDEEWLAKILGEYGNLRSLNVGRDKTKNTCRGHAFCEFETELETQNCINGLNNRVIGGRLLQVKRGMNMIVNDTPVVAPMDIEYIVDTITVQEQSYLEQRLLQVEKQKASSVIYIANAIKIDKIEDDMEYLFISRDIRKEVDKIGRLISMVIPRKKDGFQEGIGKIYLEFENEQYAKVAIILLNGTKYDRQVLDVQFYDPRLYADKLY